jgi:o-succinylbenzoate synthase
MALQASFFKKVFQFNFNARTSRGLMENKTSWFIKLFDDSDPQKFGLGECGPLPGLSPDATSDFEKVLAAIVQKINKEVFDKSSFQEALFEIVPAHLPSIIFGFETAWLDLIHGGKKIIFENGFLNGASIPINGLVWMGSFDFMMEQVYNKIQQGFKCIKLKVGGLNFDNECMLLKQIRQQYKADEITIRLDANGAFLEDDALGKLHRLSEFNIHSIEQPLREGNTKTAELCRISPVPIALDEELIHHQLPESKLVMLEKVRPAYIILKPTLHGGLRGCEQWIAAAESLGIGWWITSALESSIGLNAICQFTANYPIVMPQGLGTGAIYSNNFSSPLRTSSGEIFMDPSGSWSIQVN